MNFAFLFFAVFGLMTLGFGWKPLGVLFLILAALSAWLDKEVCVDGEPIYPSKGGVNPKPKTPRPPKPPPLHRKNC